MTRAPSLSLLPLDGSGSVACGPVAVPAPRRSPESVRQQRSWSRPCAPRLLPVAEVPSPDEPQPAAGRSQQVLLNVLAVVGLLTTGATAAAASSGLQPLVVRSGSMEPAIATGAVVLVRDLPATELRVGDVAAVQRPDRVLVTHRVVATRREGDLAVLTLKGDANREPDPQAVVAARAARVVWTLPVAGVVASELTNARGGFVLGCLVTAVGRRSVRRRRS